MTHTSCPPTLAVLSNNEKFGNVVPGAVASARRAAAATSWALVPEAFAVAALRLAPPPGAALREAVGPRVR